MEKVFKYRCRPSYGSKKLLIDFHNPYDQKELVKETLKAIKKLNPRKTDFEDLWMNDEFLWLIETDLGKIEFSIDTWGGAFIQAEENNDLIKEIDNILNRSMAFERTEVDFDEYK